MTPRERFLRRLRLTCYTYAVSWTWIALLFAIDLMDLSSMLMVLGFLVAAPIYLVLGLEVLYRRAACVARRSGAGPPVAASFALGAALSPFLLHAGWPTFYIRFFFWRHRAEMQRIVDRSEARANVTHFQDGTVFWFGWDTLSDQCFVILYEPGRAPGAPMLAKELTPLRPGCLDFDLPLGGSWYAGRY